MVLLRSQQSLRAALVQSMPSQNELTLRFYELLIRYVEDNGAKLCLNLDLLRETKNDPKAGALILEKVLTMQSVVLFSDFCAPNKLNNVYKLI